MMTSPKPARGPATQGVEGRGTRILSREEIAAKYPFYRLDDIVAGSLNTLDEGAVDAMVMVDWYRRKTREHSVDYIENEVVSINRTGDRIDTPTLDRAQGDA